MTHKTNKEISMKHYGANISVSEGTVIKNLTAPTGTSFPDNANIGELFYRTDTHKLHVCTSEGSPIVWTDITTNSLASIQDITDVDFTGSPSLTVGDTLSWDGSNWKNVPSVEYAPLNAPDFTGGIDITGDSTITGHFVPTADVTYDLGSSSLKWRDLYLSNNTIYMNTDTITVVDGKIRINNQPVPVEADIPPAITTVITNDPSIIPSTSLVESGWNSVIAAVAGANSPAAYSPTERAFGPSGSREEFAFDIGDYVYIEPFQISNNIDTGNEAYLYVHWSTDGTNTNPVVWEMTYTRAKGYGQEAFSAATTVTLTVTPSGTPWTHYVDEVPFADVIYLTEPNEIIMVTLKRITNGATENTDDIFGIQCGLHYQSTRANTPNKEPDFYAVGSPVGSPV